MAAEAGAESTVGEAFANGKAADEVMEEAVATEHDVTKEEEEEEKETEITEEEEAEGKKEREESAEAVKEEDNGNGTEKRPAEEKVKYEDKEKEAETPKKRGKTTRVRAGEEEGAVNESSRKRKAREPLTPSVSTVDRPSRERKTIERFVASTEKENAKEFTIEKGKGTLLKDIPNVAFKVSKRSRADENLKTLHMVLYGRRGKVVHFKNNILQFSGFVWGEDEEKQKGKLKDKLDKLNKENLLNLCDILDIHVSKSGTKKEEIVIKLIEFLEAPHVTTDVLLEEQIEKLKAKKRKKRNKGTPGKGTGKSSGKSPRKRQRKNVGSKEEIERTEEESEGEEDVEEENEEKESDLGDEEENEEKESEKEAEEEGEGEEEDEEDDEDYGSRKKGSKSSVKKGSKRRKTSENVGKKNLESKGMESSPKKGLKSPLKGSTSKDSVDNAVSSPQNSPTSKVFSRKNKKEKAVVDKAPASDGKKQSRKQANASVDKSNLKEKDGKTKAKGKSSTSNPSDEELRSAICEILKEVDFNTATFTDIVKRLAGKFNMDFTERKAHVKVLIQEELSKLAEGEDEEDQSMGAEGNVEKDESDEMTGQVVEPY